MIQGIPYFRLILGNETEVQLGDLAGNAMSLTVVCACMLAAVGCSELRRQSEEQSKKVEKILASACLKSNCSPATNDSLDLPQSIETTADAFISELASISSEAVASSIHCTCETSGTNSVSLQFLQCKICRVSCCRGCICSVAGYNLQSHQTQEFSLSHEEHDFGAFLSKLRAIVPSTLVFSADGIAELAGTEDKHRVTTLSNFTFNLHRMKRDRRKWLISYLARENNGFGDAVATLLFTVGEINKEQTVDKPNGQVQLGAQGTLTSFLPAKLEPLVFGPLEPCAVFYCKQGEQKASWWARSIDIEGSLRAIGNGTTDSFRVEHGITQDAADALAATCRLKHNAKDFQAAKSRGEERRWKYPNNWQVWPESITLSSGPAAGSPDPFADIYGTYTRAKCRQTTNQSALWIKQVGDTDELVHYILIRPNVGRSGPDRAIVSLSISHEDTDAIRAVFPWEWQPVRRDICMLSSLLLLLLTAFSLTVRCVNEQTPQRALGSREKLGSAEVNGIAGPVFNSCCGADQC